VSTPMIIVLALFGAGAGAVIGFFLGRKREDASSGSADAQADKLLSAATTEAETIRKNAELEAKELVIKARTGAEEKANRRSEQLEEQRSELVKKEEDVHGLQQQLQERQTSLDKKDRDVERREKGAAEAAVSATEKLQKAQAKLEELARLSPEEAREQLMDQMRDEARQASAAEIRKIEEQTEKDARERAVTIIATAVQRYASEYVAERTVSVLQLPSDEMKGRIIGREGRNIRAIEAATGVDLIIDDTPEAVILSCFNPVRREVARIGLARLIADGRIHPSRIEDVVKRATDEVNASCKEAGEQAVFDLGLHRVHPELIRILGELRFRSSYAQNLLQHAIEVGFISGLIASELGVAVKQARRAGLLHDIGKAVPHETEGSHAQVGAALAKKYGESPKVVHAIEAHHGDTEPETVLAHIVDVANQLSARRPGARRERLASYVQRLADLEQLCLAHKGVDKAYAIQAGREIRVVVENSVVNDDMAVMMSKDIAREVEDQLAYPGQIRVCVIRESRSSDMAR